MHVRGSEWSEDRVERYALEQTSIDGVSLRRTKTIELDVLRERYGYDPDTGQITGKIKHARWSPGRKVGYVNRGGYLVLRAAGQEVLAHRVAWALFHGAFPSGDIDHINGIRTDNRIANLREVSHAQNMKNSRLHFDSSVGLKGVHSHQGRWVASIMSDGEKYFLGSYDTPEEAHAAYRGAARVLHKQFARFA